MSAVQVGPTMGTTPAKGKVWVNLLKLLPMLELSPEKYVHKQLKKSPKSLMFHIPCAAPFCMTTFMHAGTLVHKISDRTNVKNDPSSAAIMKHIATFSIENQNVQHHTGSNP
jgi:hypothetical protein